ncbi:MAG: hypothetical protein UW18_C0020G0002 [Microgenomates group bacterium GW2011_GWF1_44_10]|nr:MAG: hypothetical protein UW18_C0020G0002 [Microgenomates group bacterium GW2011_GWF1_44_10]
MKTVSVGYAYPTSPHAKTYGFYNEGCYVVEIDDDRGKHTISGYANFAEAKTVAGETGLPFHKYSIMKDPAA